MRFKDTKRIHNFCGRRAWKLNESYTCLWCAISLCTISHRIIIGWWMLFLQCSTSLLFQDVWVRLHWSAVNGRLTGAELVASIATPKWLSSPPLVVMDGRAFTLMQTPYHIFFLAFLLSQASHDPRKQKGWDQIKQIARTLKRHWLIIEWVFHTSVPPTNDFKMHQIIKK